MTVQQPLPAVNLALADELRKALEFQRERLESERGYPERIRRRQNGRHLPERDMRSHYARLAGYEHTVTALEAALGLPLSSPAPIKAQPAKQNDDSTLESRYRNQWDKLPLELRERLSKARHHAPPSNIKAIFDDFDEPLSVDIVWAEYILRFDPDMPRQPISDRLSRMIGADGPLETVPALGRGHYRKRRSRTIRVVA